MEHPGQAKKKKKKMTINLFSTSLNLQKNKGQYLLVRTWLLDGVEKTVIGVICVALPELLPSLWPKEEWISSHRS